MNYQEVFESVGWKYLGPCSCRVEKGFMFQSPERKEYQLWIYPFKNKIKIREWDITKQVIGYTPETMEAIIKGLAA